MAIKDDEQAYRVAQLINQLPKDHKDRAALRAELARYIDSRPKMTDEEAAANSTQFGQRVRRAADGQLPETITDSRPRPFVGPIQEKPFVGPMQEVEQSGRAAGLSHQLSGAVSAAFPVVTGLEGLRRDLEMRKNAGIAGADMAIAGVRGTINQPAETLAGLTGGLAGAINPNDTFANAYTRERDIARHEYDADRGIIKAGRLRTPQGEALAEEIANLPGVETAGKVVDWVGDRIEAIGGPALRDIITSAVTLGTLGRLKGARPGRHGHITPEQVAELGINIKAPGNVIAQQLQNFMNTIRGNVRGENIPAIQKALVSAELAERSNVANLFDQAEKLGGRMKIPTARRIEAGMADLNTQHNVFDLNGKPVKPLLAARMQEAMRFLKAQGGNYRISLGDLERYRQRIRADMRRTRDVEEARGLQDLLGEIDRWETHAFTEAVAGGNKPAYQAWLRARNARGDYARKFTDDAILDDLLNYRGANSKELREFIFGASSVVGASRAANIVKRMKEVFGENSPEIAALRQDMLYDIVNPLLTEERMSVGIRKFTNAYEATVQKNPDLVRELAPFSMNHLEQAYQTAKALETTGLSESMLASRFDPVRIATRIMMGKLNPLAAGTAKIQIIDRIVDALSNTVKPNRKKLFDALFGTNSSAPVVSNSRRVISAAAFAQDQGEDE